MLIETQEEQGLKEVLKTHFSGTALTEHLCSALSQAQLPGLYSFTQTEP